MCTRRAGPAEHGLPRYAFLSLRCSTASLARGLRMQPRTGLGGWRVGSGGRGGAAAVCHLLFQLCCKPEACRAFNTHSVVGPVAPSGDDKQKGAVTREAGRPLSTVTAARQVWYSEPRMQTSGYDAGFLKAGSESH